MLPSSSPKIIPKVGNLPYPDTDEPRIYHQMERVVDFTTPPRYFDQNVKNKDFEAPEICYRPVVVKAVNPEPAPIQHIQPAPISNFQSAPMRHTVHQLESPRKMVNFLLNQHAPLQPEAQPVFPVGSRIKTPSQALQILDRPLGRQTLHTVQLLQELNTWHKEYNSRNHPNVVTQDRFARGILNRSDRFFSKIPTEYDNMRDKTKRVYIRVYHWLNSIGEQQREQILDMDLTKEPGFSIQ